ncbi:MAG: tetratricopeptide repeat protein [Thermodesulfobacteriota bacterium]|nr:tetratricopeptide repeat protein [Thermodesulfobacteriota bacterium]
MIKGKKRALVLAAVLVLALFAAACGPKSEEDYFIQADRQFEKGLFREAVKTYRLYLADFPEGSLRDKALFRSGEIRYYALARRASAVLDFSRLIQHHPFSDYSFQAREILAGVFRDETHDYGRAILEYQWLLNRRPESPKAAGFQFQIARCRFLDNNIEQAVLEFGRFIKRYPHSGLIERGYDELGGAHMILGRPDQALFIFQRMISLFPESPLRPAVEFKMGACLEEMQRYPEALKVYSGLRGRYNNLRAVDIRIEGVKARQKNKKGKACPVNYAYRPKFVPRRNKVSSREAPRIVETGKKKAGPGPVVIEGLNVRVKN